MSLGNGCPESDFHNGKVSVYGTQAGSSNAHATQTRLNSRPEERGIYVKAAWKSSEGCWPLICRVVSAMFTHLCLCSFNSWQRLQAGVTRSWRWSDHTKTHRPTYNTVNRLTEVRLLYHCHDHSDTKMNESKKFWILMKSEPTSFKIIKLNSLFKS